MRSFFLKSFKIFVILIVITIFIASFIRVPSPKVYAHKMQPIKIGSTGKKLNSAKFHKIDFGGSGVFTEYPLRVTTLGDFFRLDYKEEFEVAVAKINELQIDKDSGNITIVNNTISMFWEGIEIYSHLKIIVKNNVIYDCHIAIKIEPKNWDDVADVVVEGNKFISSNVLVFYATGVTLKNNFFENLKIVIVSSKNITLKMCTLKKHRVSEKIY